MKKVLLSLVALVALFAVPAFAYTPAPAPAEAPVAAPVADTTMAPAADATAETPVAPTADEAKAKEECTAETNEKVKLPENAGEPEKAQWDAAFAECLKGKSAPAEAPAADAAPVTTTEPEAAQDAAAAPATK